MEIIEIINSHNKCIVEYGSNLIRNNIIDIIFNVYKVYIRKYIKIKKNHYV